MKTLVDIDETLLEKAMRLSCAVTKKDAIHHALEELIRSKQREHLKGLAGSGVTDWSRADLKASRLKREKAHSRPARRGR